jgi:hypothetical protein
MKSAGILPLAIMLATTSMFGQSLTQPHASILPNVLSGLKWSKTAALLLTRTLTPVQRTMLISGPRSDSISKMTNLFAPRDRERGNHRSRVQ